MQTNGLDAGGSQGKAEMRLPFHHGVGLRTMEQLWQDLAEPMSTLCYTARCLCCLVLATTVKQLESNRCAGAKFRGPSEIGVVKAKRLKRWPPSKWRP
jgi:hypothetical protein